MFWGSFIVTFGSTLQVLKRNCKYCRQGRFEDECRQSRRWIASFFKKKIKFWNWLKKRKKRRTTRQTTLSSELIAWWLLFRGWSFDSSFDRHEKNNMNGNENQYWGNHQLTSFDDLNARPKVKHTRGRNQISSRHSVGLNLYVKKQCLVVLYYALTDKILKR